MAEQKANTSVVMGLSVVFTLIALISLIAMVMLRSKAETVRTPVQTANVGNTGPSFDAITVSDESGLSGRDIGPANGGIGLTTNEGTTKKLYVYGTVTDLNGCSDLASVTLHVHRSGVGASAPCEANANNCYTVTLGPTDFAGCNGGTSNTVTFATDFDAVNYIDPTDSGPYAAETWQADGVVVDASAVEASASETFEVNSLAAFSLPSTIDYGQVALGAVSNPSGHANEVVITNTGNRALNATVLANGDMPSSLGSGFASIPADAVHYSTTADFTYNVTPDTGETAVSKSTATDLTLNLAQQTSLTVPTANSYWRIKMPSTGVNGTYTNTLTLTAVYIP